MKVIVKGKKNQCFEKIQDNWLQIFISKLKTLCMIWIFTILM